MPISLLVLAALTVPGAWGGGHPADRESPGVTSPVADSLALTLVAPDRVAPGAPVPFLVQVENRSGRPLDLYLRGRTITLDFEVTDADGALVWRRLEGEMIPAIIHLRTLAPGERFDVQVEWDQRTREGVRVRAGEYRARGLLLVEGEALETEVVRFRIAAG
jgi:hypothetical protein